MNQDDGLAGALRRVDIPASPLVMPALDPHTNGEAGQRLRATIDADRLSGLLRELYDLARLPSVHDFQEQAIQCLARHVAFDNAFWGAGTLVAGRCHIHSAYAWNMPEGALQVLNMTAQDNVVAQACTARPGVAHAFTADTLYASRETAMLASLQRVRQVCCMASIDPASGLIGFLGLGRERDEPVFARHERDWLELLMPHLDVMLNLTRISQMQHIRSARAPLHLRMAVTDVKGILHVMEPGFD